MWLKHKLKENFISSRKTKPRKSFFLAQKIPIL